MSINRVEPLVEPISHLVHRIRGSIVPLPTTITNEKEDAMLATKKRISITAAILSIFAAIFLLAPKPPPTPDAIHTDLATDHDGLGLATEHTSLDQKLDQILTPPPSRFELVFNDEAVLDTETNLIWQREAGTAINAFIDVIAYCLDLTINNRKGWRVPFLTELTTLLDMSIGAGAKLPNGHPFQNVVADTYHTSGPLEFIPNDSFCVDFATGNVIWKTAPDGNAIEGVCSSFSNVMCVRGSHR